MLYFFKSENVKLTPTQKNFRKQIKNLKYTDNDIYRDRNRTVKFVTEEKKKRHPIITSIIITILLYIIPKLINYITHLK